MVRLRQVGKPASGLASITCSERPSMTFPLACIAPSSRLRDRRPCARLPPASLGFSNCEQAITAQQGSPKIKRGHCIRNAFHPNSQPQRPLRLRAAGAAACFGAASGLTSIQPSRISSFAFELEIVSSFPVSIFRTVRNRTWFIEAPPGYDSPVDHTTSSRRRRRLGCGKEVA
jgi:hypothetical protein